MSSVVFGSANSHVGYVGENGALYYTRVDAEGEGIRPVINLKSNVEITSGDGTTSNPYVIMTN